MKTGNSPQPSEGFLKRTEAAMGMLKLQHTAAEEFITISDTQTTITTDNQSEALQVLPAGADLLLSPWTYLV